MTDSQIPALLFILGTLLIYTGFGAFPPRIYTERNIQEKLKLLEAQPRRWIFCQSLVILGGIATMAGSIFLIPLFNDSQAALLAKIGAGGLVLGHFVWIWHLRLRIVEPQKFARNELPGWLYPVYAIPFLLSLAIFGSAFWLQGIHQVLGAGIFVGALLVLGLYIKLKDMPPFIYYAMTLVIGLSLLF